MSARLIQIRTNLSVLWGSPSSKRKAQNRHNVTPSQHFLPGRHAKTDDSTHRQPIPYNQNDWHTNLTPGDRETVTARYLPGGRGQRRDQSLILYQLTLSCTSRCHCTSRAFSAAGSEKSTTLLASSRLSMRSVSCCEDEAEGCWQPATSTPNERNRRKRNVRSSV